MRIVFVLFCLLPFILSMKVGVEKPLHAIYISTTDIKYQETDGVLTAKIRMFSNDFEDALRLIGSPEEPGFEEGESPHPEIDPFICTYLGQKFQVWADGQAVNFSFLGKRREDDATWVSLRAEDICELKKLRVYNAVLIELFDDQTNILRVRVGGKLKNYNLTKRIPEEIISL